jgi:hypothetical protein
MKPDGAFGDAVRHAPEALGTALSVRGIGPSASDEANPDQRQREPQQRPIDDSCQQQKAFS